MPKPRSPAARFSWYFLTHASQLLPAAVSLPVKVRVDVGQRVRAVDGERLDDADDRSDFLDHFVLGDIDDREHVVVGGSAINAAAVVADDQVDIGADGLARAPDTLAGLLEVAGLGLMRLPFLKEIRPVLVAELGPSVPRLPGPERDTMLGLPRLRLDPRGASAAARLALAFDCLLGRASMTVGAFAA